MDKYSRRYCKNCKLVFRSTGYLSNCPECGQPLELKSFNPWPKAWGGIALITVGIATVFFAEIPVVWIGAFIWGGSLIYSARKQWSKINKLDSTLESQFGEANYVELEPSRAKPEKSDKKTAGPKEQIDTAVKNGAHKREEKYALRFCPNCGYKVTEKMDFCANCGRKLWRGTKR